MTNPHRHRNRASPEHIESIRNINLKIKQNNRRKALQGKMQKMAVRFTSSFGPDWDAIDAFKGKKKYTSKSKKFESTGNELKLNGHIVARHHKDGIEVSNAGHDTNKTYSTIKGLGIHARNQKGITKLNNKVIDVNSGEFVLVPHKEISDSPITYTKTTPRKRYRSVGEQSKFRDLVEKNESEAQGRKGRLPLSQISIQPKDQRQINELTGVKSPIGKEILGVEAHHILSHKKNKGLAANPNNGIMIPKQDHKMLTSFAKLKQKIALIKSHVANQDMQADKIVDSYLSSGMGYKGMDGVYDHENSTVLNGFSNVDSQRMRDLFNGQGKFIGTNSVTDTRAGSNHDIERVRKELREVEEKGGIPALGFDGSEGGSLEALNISVVDSKEEVMNALQNTQWGTGILSPDGKFNIEESLTYKGRNNI